tara:strand:+ start:94034 stop:94468 length:435 start_codon:yes stop_codon:yes gene_type:complete
MSNIDNFPSAYIFLDDERNPYKVTHVQLPKYDWTVVKNYREFCSAIQAYYIAYRQMPKFISFDHDLAPEHYRQSMYDPDDHYNAYYTNGTFKEKTGYGCAEWLCAYCSEKNLDVPDYMVHSMNPLGKKNITALLESYKKARRSR